MTASRLRHGVGLIALALCIPTLAHSQQEVPLSVRAVPKGTAVAETRLLMEAIAHTNFKGLEKLLKQKPDDVEAWAFMRGQALLIAETGNLLLLRPPKNQGAESWNNLAREMRETAVRLSRDVTMHDLNTSRARLIELSNTCNKCHQTFRIETRLSPFREMEK